MIIPDSNIYFLFPFRAHLFKCTILVCRPHQIEASLFQRPVFKLITKLFYVQLALEILKPVGVFLLNPIVNKCCNIECCGNKMHQIVANLVQARSMAANIIVYEVPLVS